MSKHGVALLWSCVHLFVLSGTLLSIAAGLPKFAIIGGHSETNAPEGGVGSAAPSLSNSVDIGAFTAIYYDGDDYGHISALTSSIDDDCEGNWQGYEDGFFLQSDSCTQFNAFRSLLIIAIVFDFLIALALYTCILLHWLPPSVAEPVPNIRHWGLALCGVVAAASNVVSMSLMIQLVFNGISGGTTYGMSFKLMAAAFPICVIASVVLVLDCVYHASVNRSGRPAVSITPAAVGDEEVAVKDVEMAVVKKSDAAELTEVDTA
jgi:hypothetical protein